MDKDKVFVISEESSKNVNRLYVDVDGIGTIVIKRDDDGVAVEVFQLHAIDRGPIEELRFSNDALMKE